MKTGYLTGYPEGACENGVSSKMNRMEFYRWLEGQALARLNRLSMCEHTYAVPNALQHLGTRQDPKCPVPFTAFGNPAGTPKRTVPFTVFGSPKSFNQMDCERAAAAFREAAKGFLDAE